MASTVFAESMGLFHKGSGGKGVAPADVCLSPPPPPAGPVPVPYVNNLSSSDLAKGSETVKVEGNPTALEDHSEVSTSTGDEAGTQGGNILTHKTKGKGFFKLWSFTVKIEDKGVCRHGDLMGQNCASDPPGCVDLEALVNFTKKWWVDTKEPCADEYDRDNVQSDPNAAQYAAVNQPNSFCWQCGCTVPAGCPPRPGSTQTQFTPDHQPPMNVAWYAGGCSDLFKMRQWANRTSTVKPHCAVCSGSQGGTMSAISRMTSSLDQMSSNLLRQDRILSWITFI